MPYGKEDNHETNLLVSVPVCLMSTEVAGDNWGPNANDLDTAINTGDFSGYFRNISTWLNQKIPANASNVTEASMKQLLKGPVFANTLDQRQLISRHGVDKMGAFA